jgi:hypothetical protein
MMTGKLATACPSFLSFAESARLLFAEVREAMDDALIIIIVAALISLAVNSQTLIELASVSDGAVVTLFLQVGSLDHAQSDGRRERQSQRASH